MKFVKGRTSPTGAIVMGRDGIKEAYETGRGSIKVRACVRSRRPRTAASGSS